MPGTPSKTRLTNLPSASPPIKAILVIVAVTQNPDLRTPMTQIADIPRYKPIIALKIFARLTASTLKSNSSGRITFGHKP